MEEYPNSAEEEVMAKVELRLAVESSSWAAAVPVGRFRYLRGNVEDILFVFFIFVNSV